MDVSALGRAILLTSFVFATFSLLASAASTRRRDLRWALAGQRALFATTILLVAATALLVYALFARDFSVA